MLKARISKEFICKKANRACFLKIVTWRCSKRATRRGQRRSCSRHRLVASSAHPPRPRGWSERKVSMSKTKAQVVWWMVDTCRIMPLGGPEGLLVVSTIIPLLSWFAWWFWQKWSMILEASLTLLTGWPFLQGVRLQLEQTLPWESKSAFLGFIHCTISTLSVPPAIFTQLFGFCLSVTVTDNNLYISSRCFVHTPLRYQRLPRTPQPFERLLMTLYYNTRMIIAKGNCWEYFAEKRKTRLCLSQKYFWVTEPCLALPRSGPMIPDTPDTAQICKNRVLLGKVHKKKGKKANKC